MKTRILLLSLIAIVIQSALAQSKLFISAGTNFNTNIAPKSIYYLGQGYVNFDPSQSKKWFRYSEADILLENRIGGIAYLVTGLMFHQGGYETKGQFNSKYDITSLAIPLGIRMSFLNIYNADLLFLSNFTLNAKLAESSGSLSDEADITSYASTFTPGLALQAGVSIRRISVNWYVIMVNKQFTKDFSDVWKLPPNQSVFLYTYSTYSYFNMGLKVSFRIL